MLTNNITRETIGQKHTIFNNFLVIFGPDFRRCFFFSKSMLTIIIFIMFDSSLLKFSLAWQWIYCWLSNRFNWFVICNVSPIDIFTFLLCLRYYVKKHKIRNWIKENKMEGSWFFFYKTANASDVTIVIRYYIMVSNVPLSVVFKNKRNEFSQIVCKGHLQIQQIDPIMPTWRLIV